MANLEQQMRHRDKEMVPRFLVIAMFTLMVFSVALVALAQITDRPNVGNVDHIPIVREQLVTFDGERNAYTVSMDGETRLVSTDSGSGVVSAIGGSLVFTRNRHDADHSAPVRLVQREDGRLALIDTVSPWTVELSTQGSVATDLFLTLLPKEDN